MNIPVSQTRRLPDEKTLEALDHLILFLPAGSAREPWPALPYAELLRRRAAGNRSAAEARLVVCDLPNANGTHVSLSLVRADLPSFELLALARRHAAEHWERDPRTIAIAVAGFDAAAQRRIFEAATLAVLARAAPMPSFKSGRPTRPRLAGVRLFGAASRIDLARVQAEAEGNHLARELTALPSNALTPGSYRRRITRLARERGWVMRFYDSRALRRLRAGAFLAVAQGSPVDDAGIVHLRYRPRGRARSAALALVGKGICYDTGGMNLKPPKHMHGMHEDMAGSAVALGTLLALTRLRAPFPVDCWLALAQNHIGPSAYKQNDVVTAANGTSIEIVHTDAEGRMVLADTLTFAARRKPGLIIDYATLTGACVYALSTRYSGAFTNRPALVQEVIAAGQASGERVWPFPLDDDFDQPLDSTIADVKQCTLEGEADHILAARFLKRFVADRPWLHIDLSAANHKGGLAHVPTDVTGFGVRFTLELLLNRGVLAAIE